MEQIRKVLWLLTSLVALETWAAETTGIGIDETPVRVRHDVAQSGEAILTLRYFKVRKGSYPEFVAVSREGVWPFFEKIGARVVGMWQVIHPADTNRGAAAVADYDEVWLLTRYASVAHWRATRDMARLGGNGPDYRKAIAALARRAELTLATDVRFLSGPEWHNPPQFLPVVD
jgi:hypothetical protein